MRWLALILCGFLGLGLPTSRAEDARRDQIDAAAAQAFDSLRREVVAVPLTNDVTIGAFVDRCQAGDELDATLSGAQQIGGARWLDDQTVQVRLEIRGADIAKTIEKIAEKNPTSLPMSLHALRQRVKKLFSRGAYSTTGTSTAASAATRLRPDPAQIAWRSVSDGDRQSAIEAARHNAIDRAIDSLRSVEWTNGKRRLADALDAPGVSDALREWFSARPITLIEFRDDLEVRLSLAASAADLWPRLADLLTKQAAVSLPHDTKEWDALRHQVKLALVPAIGIAPARAIAPAANAAPGMIVPRAVPVWASTSTDAEGIAGSVGDKLKTARVAENIAMTHLRAGVEALSLDANTTVGQAAQKDPRIAQALARGLVQAQISKVDYDTPGHGAVRVKMTLNLEAVWRELSK